MMKNKVVLTGYMGVGKTTIGELLAKKLQMKHLDLDEIIEKSEGLSIQKIFETKGEIYFRKVEHQIFKNLIEKKSDEFVLSTGGGTPCYANNHLLLQYEDINSFYLKASLETLKTRLFPSKSKRPLIAKLNDDEMLEFIAKHVFERSYYYQHSKFTIKVDDKRIEDIIVELSNIIVNKH